MGAYSPNSSRLGIYQLAQTGLCGTVSYYLPCLGPANLEDKPLGVVSTNKVYEHAHSFTIQGDCSDSVRLLILPEWFLNLFTTARAKLSCPGEPGLTMRT